MLCNVEKDGLEHIISWRPHGRCFMLHKPKEFVSDVMPLYFSQTKLTSFHRQLNLYGFCRLISGRDRGGYYHELFLKHRVTLCKHMRRTRIKGDDKNVSNPFNEPDFYKMPFVEPLPAVVDTSSTSSTKKCQEGSIEIESLEANMSETIEEALKPRSFVGGNQQLDALPDSPLSLASIEAKPSASVATPTMTIQDTAQDGMLPSLGESFDSALLSSKKECHFRGKGH